MPNDSRQRQRIQAILQIRLDGAELWDVQDFVAQQERDGAEPWAIAGGEKPLNAAQIGVIVRAADRLIAEAYPDDPPDVARHKAKLRSLYARAVQAGDVRTARAILNDLGKLDGLSRRKPTLAIPAKVKEATAKLRAKFAKQKKVDHARQTKEADVPAHSERDVHRGPPRDERADAVAGDPAAPPPSLKICPPNVGQAD